MSEDEGYSDAEATEDTGQDGTQDGGQGQEEHPIEFEPGVGEDRDY
jgi:hypothetical protein